jgi:S-adenosylmethionine uptake transporter
VSAADGAPPAPVRASFSLRGGKFAGVSYIFAAYFLYAVGDAAAKWLVGSISVWEVLFTRSWMSLLILLALGGRRTLEALQQMLRERGLLGMNLANFGGWAAYYSAAVWLPLPQLYTAYYLSPIFAALLARPMLGERIHPASWAAGTLGFAGVVVTVAPVQGPAPQLLPALLGVASALLWALSSILYRRKVHHCSSLVLVLNSNIVIGALSAVPLAFEHPSFNWPRTGALLLVSVSGLAAIFLYIGGVRRVSVAVAGPIGYFSLVWSVLLAYFIWGDVPHAGFLAGGSLILLAGLLVFAGEWRRSRRAAGRVASA